MQISASVLSATALKTGYLVKRGYDFPWTWKKRYFILTRDCLYYFTNPEVWTLKEDNKKYILIIQQASAQKGEVILSQVSRARPERDEKINEVRAFVFMVETKERYCLWVVNLILILVVESFIFKQQIRMKWMSGWRSLTNNRGRRLTAEDSG